MLPDFPSLKQELHRLLVVGVRVERPRTSSLMAGFPGRPMLEGNRIILVRDTGEEVEIPLKLYSAEQYMETTETETLTLEEAYEKYREVMAEMDEKQAEDFFKLIDETAESIGNVVDLGGRPLPEGILEGVEKMLLLDDPRDVDQLFNLHQVRLMLREAPSDAIEDAREQMKSGPYKEQTERLLERKHEEYRVRESRRKLVN